MASASPVSCLSKLDGDARGGAALSVREVTGQPILFASTGEKLEDFDVFHPDRMASRILGMGDMLTLIEQAESAFDEDQKERMTAKLVSGESFTLEDFLEQMTALRRMGPIANMLSMIPGMNQFKDQLAQIDDKHFDKISAIIRGMTPGERVNPKILNASRRARIANGSGVTVMDVNQLLNRFAEAQKQMKQMSGMMGLPGMRRKATKSPKNKRKGGGKANSGGRRASGSIPAAGGGGMPALPKALDPSMFEGGADPGGFTLPKLDFSKLTKRDKYRWRPDTCEGCCSPRTRSLTCGGRTTGSAATPMPGVETVAVSGFILPGLVDAHCHIGIRQAVRRGVRRRGARHGGLSRDIGVLALRDAGSPIPTPNSTTTGRCRAWPGPAGTSPRPKRYLRGLGVEVEADELPAALTAQARQATAGSSWSATGSTADGAISLRPGTRPRWPSGRGRARRRSPGRCPPLRRGVGRGAGAGRGRLGRARHRTLRGGHRRDGPPRTPRSSRR